MVAMDDGSGGASSSGAVRQPVDEYQFFYDDVLFELDAPARPEAAPVRGGRRVASEAALQGVPAEVRLPWQRFMPLYGWAWNLFQVGRWMGWWVGRSQICFIIDGLVDWDD